jgi:hypothetical protein
LIRGRSWTRQAVAASRPASIVVFIISFISLRAAVRPLERNYRYGWPAGRSDEQQHPLAARLDRIVFQAPAYDLGALTTVTGKSRDTALLLRVLVDAWRLFAEMLL